MADKLKKKLLKHILHEMDIDLEECDKEELEELLENAETIDDFSEIIDMCDGYAELDLGD